MKIHNLLGRLLIAFLFLIEIPRYQATLPDDNTLVALGMGVLLSGGAYYIIESWGMLRRRGGTPPRGTNRLLTMTAILIVAVPVIMTPAMVADEHQIATIDVLSNLGAYLVEILWMCVITLVPVLTGIFVAYAQALQYSRSELKGSDAERRSKSLAANRQRISEFSATQGANSATLVSENGRSKSHVCEACGAEFATPQGLSGHKRHCNEWRALKAQAEQEIPEL